MDEVYAKQLRRRLWNSERLRTLLAILLLATAAANSIMRSILNPGTEVTLLLVGLGMLAFLAAVEVAWLRHLKATRGREEAPSSRIIAAMTLLESNFPTLFLLLVFLFGRHYLTEVLHGPIVLMYFPFVIMTILRMRPWLCILSAVGAGGGYTAVWLASIAEGLAAPVNASWGAYYFIPVCVGLLISGVIAAVISRQILMHLSQSIASMLRQRKLEEDMALAQRIQRGLLPEAPPEMPSFDIAGVSEPADETGGDYFDWLTLSDGRLVTVLADVTGHGVGPALLAANLHAYVHAVVGEGEPLDACVGRLNDHMVRDAADGRFATFAMAEVTPGGKMAVLSAGHGPILYLDAAAGAVRELESQGPPLGILPDCSYEPAHYLTMQEGDLLAMFTDGYFEWANPDGDQFGIDRLTAHLLEHRDKPAAEIIASLKARLVAFARGTTQADDLTLVILRRLAEDVHQRQ